MPTALPSLVAQGPSQQYVLQPEDLPSAPYQLIEEKGDPDGSYSVTYAIDLPDFTLRVKSQAKVLTSEAEARDHVTLVREALTSLHDRYYLQPTPDLGDEAVALSSIGEKQASYAVIFARGNVVAIVLVEGEQASRREALAYAQLMLARIDPSHERPQP